MITNDVNLHQNCDKIEAMVRHCEPGDVVEALTPDSQGIVTLMNAGGDGEATSNGCTGVCPQPSSRALLIRFVLH